MEKNYQKPQMDLIRFATEDVLNGSSGIELPDHEWSLRTVSRSVKSNSQNTSDLHTVSE